MKGRPRCSQSLVRSIVRVRAYVLVTAETYQE